MKNTHVKPESSQKVRGTGVEIVELMLKIEKLLKRTRSIAWISYKKLESIDESIAIFAAQKKLEITAETTEAPRVE